MIKKTQLAVIGAGASGLLAAITAASSSRHIETITLLEAADRVGKKILATGNGRCNLSNQCVSARHYNGDTLLIEPILHAYPTIKVLQMFTKLGLLCKEGEQGRLYPYSLQAATVLDLLRLNAQKLGIQTICDCKITAIKEQDNGFLLQSSNQDQLFAKKVILATGGKAAPQLGATGDGYLLAQQMGHTVTPLYPALAMLKTPLSYVKALKGMRCQVAATLKLNDRVVRYEKGEVQFTEQGLSGICMFQFSRHAATGLSDKQRVCVLLDLMPDYQVSELVYQLQHTTEHFPKLPATELLNGFLNKKVGQAVMKTVLEQSKATMLKQLSSSELIAIANTVKRFQFPIIGVADWKQAQVTAGGVPLSQLTTSLESKLHSGLYFAGELLNIDGVCGGYNLHWAWVSGMTAGKAAAKSLCHKSKGRMEAT